MAGQVLNLNLRNRSRDLTLQCKCMYTCARAAMYVRNSYTFMTNFNFDPLSDNIQFISRFNLDVFQCLTIVYDVLFNFRLVLDNIIYLQITSYTFMTKLISILIHFKTISNSYQNSIQMYFSV